MNVLDVLLLAATVAAAYAASRRPPQRQLITAFGAIVGLCAAAFLYSRLAFLTGSGSLRGVLLGVITLGVGFLCYDMVLTIGNRVQRSLQHGKKPLLLPLWQRVVSAGISGLTCVVGLWLLIQMLGGLPPAIVQRQVQSSAIVSGLTERFGVPVLFRQVAHLLEPFGSPQAFADGEPAFSTAIPAISQEFTTLDAATAKAKASVVKVSSWGCGTTSVGSGFVAASNLVVTNAHVVAGADRMSIQAVGAGYVGQVVFFDPKLDIAVLRTTVTMSPTPLRLYDDVVSVGTIGSIVGYPGGGGIVTSDGIVLQSMTARGYDIYDQDTISRSIYVLRAAVTAGNSGGPLIGITGQVIGVVFGHSTAQRQTGYALTSDVVATALQTAQGQTAPVTNGPCTGS